MFAIVVLSALVVACAVSVWLVVRDVRQLHRTNRSMADKPMSAAGVAPAGLIVIGDNLLH